MRWARDMDQAASVAAMVDGAPAVVDAGSGSQMDEAGSNSFTGRNVLQLEMKISCRVPGYTAFLDDGTRLEVETKDYIVELHQTNGYTMCNLLADIALWDKRRRIGSKLHGTILPTIIKQLKAKTRGLSHMKVHKNSNSAEVFGLYHDMTPWGHVVDLNTHTCSCGEWEMTGKPCPHALAFIQMFPDIDMATFVHEYYSVERFRTAYSASIPHITDKTQWPEVDMGFKLLPPPLKRAPGRQRKNRFKASHEPGARKQQRCHKCGEFGHRENGNCPLNDTKKRKKKAYPPRKPKKPNTISADTISPGSLTRKIVNLARGDDEVGTSTSTISAKRLLVLSHGGEAASKKPTKEPTVGSS